MLPGISGGDRIALRQLLDHTVGAAGLLAAGLQLRGDGAPTTPQGIVDRWARKPLDYAPGTQCQYSNTGYVVAGLIAEKVAGEPLMAYLKRRIFTPARHEPDRHRRHQYGPAFPAGYHRYALGPGARSRPRRRRLALRGRRIVDDRRRPRQMEHRPAQPRLVPADDWAAQENAGPARRRHRQRLRPRRRRSARRRAAASSTMAANRSASCRRTPSIPTSARRSSVLTNSWTSAAPTDSLTREHRRRSSCRRRRQRPRRASATAPPRSARGLSTSCASGTLDRTLLTAERQLLFHADGARRLPRRAWRRSASRSAFEPLRPAAAARRLREPGLYDHLCRTASVDLSTFDEPGR